MANALVSFLHEELSAAAQHLVALKVADLVRLKTQLQTDANVARSVLVEMGVIWGDLKPVEKFARVLFPTLDPLFDVLDKMAALDAEFLAVTK